MKNLYTTVFIKLFLPLLFTVLFSAVSFAQTFYTVFPDDEAAFYVSHNDPSGNTCIAPPLANELNVVNSSMSDFAVIHANLLAPLTCKPGQYKIKTDLNLGGIEALPAGYYAGFMIKTSSLLDFNTLKSSITINTYADGEYQESGTGTKLIGADLLSVHGQAMVYFKATRAFSAIELEIKSTLIPVNIAFDVNVYYGTGFSNEVWPVSISNFKATLTGTAAALSWTSANEVNLKNYEIERSTNGINFQTIGIVNTIKGDNTKNYHYTDANLLSGNYYYRIKSVDNDGKAVRTGIASVLLSGAAAAIVYPTLIQGKKPLWIKTTQTGTMHISVYDLQGRLVQQATKNTDGLTSIATAALSRGMYFVKASFNNNATIAVQQKFIVE